MRTEPDLDQRSLMRLLRERYELDIARLEFVPHGIDSWSYEAVSGDGNRAFVKLSRRERAEGAASRGWELPLLVALADAGRVPVARPVADRDGGYVNRVDGFEVHVLEFIDGRSLADETDWPAALYGRVAETVAAVHASTGQVRYLVPRTESYELPFLPALADGVRGIVAGDAVPDGDEPSVAELRRMIVARADALSAAFARLLELRERARTRGADDVLCHTDIWGSNLLLSDDGTLHLVDWDGALMGPPESDLFMFAGTGFFPADRFVSFLDRYETAFRPVRLDADVFGLYLYRRNLEDLADFVDAIVRGRSDAMAPEETLGIIRGLLAEVPRIEGRIEHLRRVLAGRFPGA